MDLVSATVFITVLLCSTAQSQASVISADCNDVEIEKDAELALDLINKHRRDGYIFTLLRIVNAYIQHVSNVSIVYLTLDILETECPVLSRKHWSSCGQRQFYLSTDFGQCKTVMSIDHFLNRKKLYGYNCTVSPVPPQLYECKRCPVKVTVLQDTEEFAEEAKMILERYKQESNETRNFMVEKVQKVFSAVADRTVYVIEFTIKEAVCPVTTSPTNVSECAFLPHRCAHMGFCTGRVLKDAKDPDGVEVRSCEIYNIHYGSCCFYHHHCFHHDSGKHHHCNISRHECRSPPVGPSHHHHPYHHHYGCGHYHRYRHGQGYRYPGPPPGNHHNGLTGHVGHHNSSEQDKKGYPDFPPPPGPQYPPPPPGGPHHLPPSRYPSPPVGPPLPPPPHRPHGLPPPPDHPSPPWVHKHGHHLGHHDHRCHNTSKGREGSSSEQPDSFRNHDAFCHNKVDLIHHIPVLSEHDILQAPGANFLNHPASPHGKQNEPPFPGTHVHKKSVVHPFPEVPSESKSCPGEPKSEPPPGLLPLYPS